MEMGKLGRSFQAAVNGIVISISKERNLRIELSVVVLIIFFARYYELNGNDYATLFMTIGVVLSAEMFNSAMERMVDMAHPQRSHIAGQIKDIAAGGVLISSILSVAVGVSLFWDTEVFRAILLDLQKNKLSLFVLIALVVLCLLFICLCKGKDLPPKD
jgi:undecaprenol kinase